MSPSSQRILLFKVFWTHANHTGEAIEKVLIACSKLQIPNAIASEVGYHESVELPAGVVHDKKLKVFYHPQRNYFPTEETFIAPFGIIKATENGKLDYGLIHEGFAPAEKMTAFTNWML